MIRTYSQMHRTDKYSQHSSIIWPVWPNGWVFLYKQSGFGFESSCSHLVYLRLALKFEEYFLESWKLLKKSAAKVWLPNCIKLEYLGGSLTHEKSLWVAEDKAFYGEMSYSLGHWIPNQRIWNSKPLGCPKVDSAFHSFEVDRMSTNNSLGVSGKNTLKYSKIKILCWHPARVSLGLPPF